MKEQNVFLTEVAGLQDGGPAASAHAVAAPAHAAELRSSEERGVALTGSQRFLVDNIYDFPSVQALRVENGCNMPFRFRMKTPGRAPMWRAVQGKKLTQQSQRMGNHHAIFTGDITDTRETRGQILSEKLRRDLGTTLPAVHRPDRTPSAPGPAQPPPSSTPHGRPSSGASSRRSGRCPSSEAAYYRERDHAHRASVVGSDLVGPSSRAAAAAAAPPAAASSGSFSGGVASSSSQARLSKDSVSHIRPRSQIDVPQHAPAADAPVPVPYSPLASSVASSNASKYEHLTSVSMRTPQSSGLHGSHAQSRLKGGIRELKTHLRQEASHTHEVQKELASLKARQEALIQALSSEQREQLSQKMHACGLDSK